MKLNNRFVKISIRLLMAGLTLSLLVAPSGPAYARGGGGHGQGEHHGDGGRHHGEREEGHRGRHGSIVRELPAGSIEVLHKGDRFYFHDGRLFSSHRDGYLVIRAPLAAVVLSLPAGSRRFEADGRTYYAVDDNYYRQTADGYMVVDPPHR